MPDFPIVDTHVHLADPQQFSHPWMADIPALNHPWSLADYHHAVGDVQVGKMLFMEVNCNPNEVVREVEWVTRMAVAEPRLQGIIAKAPIETGAAVTETLDLYRANPLVKAIRRLIQGEAAGFCLQPNFLEGLRQLARYDYVFDICIHHPQLSDTIQMVRACPGVRFVLDHIAKPDIKGGVMEPWKTQVAELAALDNVVCKVSGVVTEADCARWTTDDLRPYLDRIVEVFGFDRLVFGGDWFVQTLASTYPRWVEVLDTILAGCSEEDLRKLYVLNAERVYRI